MAVSSVYGAFTSNTQATSEKVLWPRRCLPVTKSRTELARTLCNVYFQTQKSRQRLCGLFYFQPAQQADSESANHYSKSQLFFGGGGGWVAVLMGHLPCSAQRIQGPFW